MMLVIQITIYDQKILYSELDYNRGKEFPEVNNIGIAVIPQLIFRPNIGKVNDIPTLGAVIVWDFYHSQHYPNIGDQIFFPITKIDQVIFPQSVHCPN